ncbi:hypothetical protein [Campylobacter jejuni]|uniref:hypothetical protein n=1 Tax=Campylobacter jejuni TaxID=197 RepID=UPI0013A5C36E|nr:hypothetical protein [Campylobacter jejuni]
MRKNEVINKAINEGINEVIKGEKNTFLFQGLKITKMAILLTKLMNVRYKNFLGAIFKKDKSQ